MKTILSLYGRLLQPWLCVATYFWLLILLAVVGDPPEPLLDQWADCSVILLASTLWVAVMCLIPLLAAVLWDQSIALRVNLLAAKVGLVVVSAFFLLRWLVQWQLLYQIDDFLTVVLSVSTLVVACLAYYRRKRGIAQACPSSVSLADIYRFGVLPILVSSLAIIGLKIMVFLGSRGLIVEPAHEVVLAHNGRSLPNIVLLISDALRVQSMSLYGYDRKTTPFLEKFATTSTVYLQMHTNSTTSNPAFVSLLSGKTPFSHGKLTRELPEYRSQENILRVLEESGYTTAAISSNESVSMVFGGLASQTKLREYRMFQMRRPMSWLYDMGVHPTWTGGKMYLAMGSFFSHLGFQGWRSVDGVANKTLMMARQTLPQLPEPFFLVVHIAEPHAPHNAPPPFAGTYSSKSDTELATKWKKAFIGGDLGHYDPEFQSTVDAFGDRYDESIRFLDSELEKFFDFVSHAGWAKNLLILFTSDHGESFERGYMNHGEPLYESSTHVPLIIRFPKQKEGARMPGLVQSADIAPTILDAIGLPVPSWMDGHPLRHGKTPEAHESVAVNYRHPVNGIHFVLPTGLAIWSDHYKMILSCDDGKVELYNLQDDPQESSDLSAGHGKLIEKLKGRLRHYLARQSREPILACDAIN